ncbi:MAG: alginate export family protein [Deltaproteobacteria bacterium]|nr:alginate export family protein [Deltaproteobacteria bacterium]
MPGRCESSDSSYSLEHGGVQLYQSQDKQTRLTLGGEVIARYEYWQWFAAPADKNEYSYWFQRTRLALKLNSKHFDFLVEPQYVHMFGLPDDAVSRAPQGPLGMGGLYYLHNEREDPYRLGFYQAYLRLRDLFHQDISVKVGRFAYSDGLEAVSGADGIKFNTLKNMRLSDRLISTFDWSAFSRSFDGALLAYTNRHINFTTSLFYPTRGGWDKRFNNQIRDIQIITATLTAKRGALLPGAELAGFYYKYKDKRKVTQRIDNCGSIACPEGVDIDIHMLGGRLIGLYGLGPGQLDVLAWGGAQFGDWYEIDHRAFAFDCEAGYQFIGLPWKPWLRMGYYIGSGDDDPGDGDHGTFFQMAPGTRKYELLPFYDLMNVKDLFFQLILRPLERMTIRTEYHCIRLSESRDRWYMGSGPTQERESVFGYLARPTNGQTDLARELDIISDITVNQHCKLLFSYSHIFGRDVISKIYTSHHDADFFSVEVELKF